MKTFKYYQFEDLFKSVYDYVQQTGNIISVHYETINNKNAGKRSASAPFIKKLVIRFQNEVEFIMDNMHILPYKNIYGLTKLSQLCMNNNINLEILINKQLLLFL